MILFETMQARMPKVWFSHRMNYTVHPGTTGSLELKSFWCYVDRLSFNMAEDLNISDASNAPLILTTVNKGSNITVHVIFIFLKYVTLSDDFCFCFFFKVWHLEDRNQSPLQWICQEFILGKTSKDGQEKNGINAYDYMLHFTCLGTTLCKSAP